MVSSEAAHIQSFVARFKNAHMNDREQNKYLNCDLKHNTCFLYKDFFNPQTFHLICVVVFLTAMCLDLTH